MRVLSLCGGIETGYLALKNLGIPVEEYHTFEILPEAIAVSQYHFPEIVHHGDVFTANWEDFKGFDLVIGGTCCFTGDTLVLTKDGYKPISSINIGETVLTHNGTYKKVINTFKRESLIYQISTMQSDVIKTTENHPFYVRKLTRKWDAQTKQNKRIFSSPEWLKVNELDKSCYVGAPINTIEKIPDYDGINIPINQFAFKYQNCLKKYMGSSDFWWFVGRFIGDGWISEYVAKRENGRERIKRLACLCCGKHEVNILKENLNKLDFHYTLSEKRTTYEFYFNNYELVYFLKQFKKGASNKRLNDKVIDLPVNLLSCFLDGYISADGCYLKNKKQYQIITTSKCLAYDLITCINKVYKRHCTISHSIRPKKYIIEDREVNQQDTYIIRFSVTKNKQDKAFYENGYIWAPIRFIKPTEDVADVFNIEVEEDHSYVVQNVIVHNCQSLSKVRIEDKSVNNGLLGKSGIVYELQKALDIIQPKYFMAENVVPSRYEDYLELNRIMKCEGIMINSNLFSAQDRPRYYWTNINFGWLPESNPLVIKDIMEHDVDEKYFYKKDFEIIDMNKRVCATLLVNTMEMNKRIYNVNYKSPTLTCINGGYHEKKIMDNGRPRKLTEIEYERLQGLPDNFTNVELNGKKLSYTKRCSLCGNGWCLPVIEYIFKGIR